MYAYTSSTNGSEVRVVFADQIGQMANGAAYVTRRVQIAQTAQTAQTAQKTAQTNNFGYRIVEPSGLDGVL